MEYFIGLDAHSKTCTFVTLDKEGERISHNRVSTCESLILKYVRSHNNGVVNLVYEESNMSQWFYLLLKNEVDNLVCCDPGYIGKKRGAKNDYADALHLANELRCRHVVPVYHEDSEIWSMRVLVQGYLDFTSQLVQTKNRYKALLRSNNLKSQGPTVYKDESEIEKLPTAADRYVANGLFGQIHTLSEIKKSYLPEFESYAKKHKVIKTLCSVPGISVIRATIITSLVCSAHRFANKHKFWAYCMLVKRIEESDDRVVGKKAVQGRRELKTIFDGAALVALAGSSSLRKYYDSKRSKGTSHNDARKDVARRIASICLSILKKGKKFDDKYEVKRKRRSNKTA